jgi:hypothetical protein
VEEYGSSIGGVGELVDLVRRVDPGSQVGGFIVGEEVAMVSEGPKNDSFVLCKAESPTESEAF